MIVAAISRGHSFKGIAAYLTGEGTEHDRAEWAATQNLATSDPQIAARNSDYVDYANGSKDAQPLMKKDILTDPSIYPPAEVFGHLFTTTPNTPEVQRIVTRMWTKIKSGS